MQIQMQSDKSVVSLHFSKEHHSHISSIPRYAIRQAQAYLMIKNDAFKLIGVQTLPRKTCSSEINPVVARGKIKSDQGLLELLYHTASVVTIVPIHFFIGLILLMDFNLWLRSRVIC